MAPRLGIKGGHTFLVLLFVSVIKGCFGITCLSCENANSLDQCNHFVECAPEETCFIEKYLNQRTYQIVHRTGCRNIHDCKLVECNKEIFGTTASTTQTVISSTIHHRIRRDLVVCTNCCYSDTCNTNGCGSFYYDENETTLHCFKKDKVVTNETVQDVDRCQPNELCSHTRKIFSGTYGYSLGCTAKKMCNFLEQLAVSQGQPPETRCCDKPLCNTNPLAMNQDTRNITQQLMCPTALVKTTTPITVSPTTPKAPTPPSTVLTVINSPTTPTTKQTSTSTTRLTTITTRSSASTTQTTSTRPTTRPTTSTLRSTTTTSRPTTTPTRPTTTTTRPTTATTRATTTTTRPTTSTSRATTTITTTMPATTPTRPKTSTTRPTTTTTQATTTTTQATTTTTRPTTTTTSTTRATTTTTQATTTTRPTLTTSQVITSATRPTTASSRSTTTTTRRSTTTRPTTTTTRATTTTTRPTTTTQETTTTQQTTTASATNATLLTGSTRPSAFTTAPNATLVPQTTALKQLVTLPPVTTRCYKCAGPPEACDLAVYEDDCPAPNNYCINRVTNLASGDRLIDRGCTDVQSCYKEWYLGSSDDDKCRQLNSNNVLTYSFDCAYCCTKNGCNYDLHPKADSLYSPKK